MFHFPYVSSNYGRHFLLQNRKLLFNRETSIKSEANKKPASKGGFSDFVSKPSQSPAITGLKGLFLFLLLQCGTQNVTE